MDFFFFLRTKSLLCAKVLQTKILSGVRHVKTLGESGCARRGLITNLNKSQNGMIILGPGEGHLRKLWETGQGSGISKHWGLPVPVLLSGLLEPTWDLRGQWDREMTPGLALLQATLSLVPQLCWPRPGAGRPPASGWGTLPDLQPDPAFQTRSS